MATIYSSDLKLSIMATGENAGTWGSITNTNLYLLQQAIGGYEAISIAGGAQTTALTMSNGAISNARNAVIKLTGTITGNQIVTIPTAIEKTYIVSNGTVGAFTVEFKQAGGTGVTFAAADKSTKILFADGTNIVETGNTTPIITQINDTNVNEQIKFTTTASAVNEFTITNAATANAPEISATGSDTNIDLKITPKGSGKINLDGIKFPNADGSSGQALTTDGSGVLSFSTVVGVLTGSIVMYGSASIPTGYLECNAQAVSRSTYAALFAVIGTTFGVGDGTTTFNVPDLRDNFPVGVSGTKALATKAGANTATLATTNLASHRHGLIGSNYTAGQVDTTAVQPRQNAYNFDISGNIGATGSGTAFNTFPPYIALTFIIKT